MTTTHEPTSTPVESIPHLDDRRYWRPADVVRVTGLSRSKVMAAIWSGELAAFQRDRAWLIPVDALDRWIRGDDAA